MPKDKPKPCKRPPAGTPKAELRKAHKVKMHGKFFRNLERFTTRAVQAIGQGLIPRPNMSDRALKKKNYSPSLVRKFRRFT